MVYGNAFRRKRAESVKEKANRRDRSRGRGSFWRGMVVAPSDAVVRLAPSAGPRMMR